MKGERLQSVEVLRLLLASLVVVYHAFLLKDQRSSDFLYVLTQGQLQSGRVCVNLFFILSGWLIYESMGQMKSVSSYLSKRISRIFPAFLVAFFVSVYVFGFIGAEMREAYYFLLDAPTLLWQAITLQEPTIPTTFLNDFTRGEHINQSLWTIPFEFGCYLLVAVQFLTKLRNRWFNLALFLGSYLFMIYSDHVLHPGRLLSLWPMFLSSFAAGMTAHSWREHLHFSSKGCVLALLLFLLGTVCGFAYEIAPLILPYLLFTVCRRTNFRLPRWLQGADLSYGTYVYSMPITLTLHLIWPAIPAIPLAIATLAAVYPASFLSWKYVEKPAIQFGKNLRLFPQFGWLKN